jgi:hypothetical protein
LYFARQGNVVTFAVDAAEIGCPREFDFYAVVKEGDEFDEAPSHVLISAGAGRGAAPPSPAQGAAAPSALSSLA